MLSHVKGEEVSTASRISVADAPDATISSRAGWNCALFGLSVLNLVYPKTAKNSHTSLIEFGIALKPTHHLILTGNDQGIFSTEVVEPEVPHILEESRSEGLVQLLCSFRHSNWSSVEGATRLVSWDFGV